MQLTALKYEAILSYLEVSSKMFFQHAEENGSQVDLGLAEVAYFIRELMLQEQADEFNELLEK